MDLEYKLNSTLPGTLIRETKAQRKKRAEAARHPWMTRERTSVVMLVVSRVNEMTIIGADGALFTSSDDKDHGNAWWIVTTQHDFELL